MNTPTNTNAAQSPPASTQRRALDWLLRVALAWLGFYLLEQGINGFFARTVDAIDTPWVKFIFLNLPLQILLATLTLVASRSTRAGALKVGLFLGTLNGVLILVHIVLSIASA